MKANWLVSGIILASMIAANIVVAWWLLRRRRTSVAAHEPEPEEIVISSFSLVAPPWLAVVTAVSAIGVLGIGVIVRGFDFLIFLAALIAAALPIAGYYVAFRVDLWPTFRIRPAIVRKGDPLRFEWTIRGDADRLRTLSIKLEGREEKFVEDKWHKVRTFREVEVIDTSERFRLRGGSAELAFPDDTLCTHYVQEANLVSKLVRARRRYRWLVRIRLGGRTFALENSEAELTVREVADAGSSGEPS